MSLRWKILLVITLTGLMIIGAVYAVSEMTFMKSYQEVENQNAQQMVERADKALNDDIQSINTLNHDWAAWTTHTILSRTPVNSRVISTIILLM